MNATLRLAILLLTAGLLLFAGAASATVAGCPEDCNGFCEIDEEGTSDCDGICDPSDAGGPDCDGVCDPSDAPPDCNFVCDPGDSFPDCDGICDAGDSAPDCDGVCDGLDGPPDCDGFCDPGDTFPDCDETCNPGDSFPDCDGVCDGIDGPPDCDGVCDPDDSAPDCDGSCSPGDSFPDCDGVCDGIDGPPDCDGVCDPGDTFPDCDGICDPGDNPPDCAPVEITLDPFLALNAPGGNHTVTATVLDGAGNGHPGVDVTFAVVFGPNAGAGGVCTEPGGTPTATCTTDADGMVNFTYDSDGTIGLDEIAASFEADAGTIGAWSVYKAWDNDCNTNENADTCDLSCDGFGGACSLSPLGCGGSSDSNGDNVPDECNAPPECDDALADPAELWPPNHKMRTILVEGVTDPDGDPVEVTVDAIFQDEPVYNAGNLGDLSPDGAGIGLGGGAAVRAERDPQQDGRVYHISFSAEDGSGGICEGVVTVCVPVNKRPGSGCVDGGPLIDSTITAVVTRPNNCGLGVELALLLPPLWLLRRRRRRRTS